VEAKSGKVKVIEEYEGVGQAVPERLEWHYVLGHGSILREPWLPYTKATPMMSPMMTSLSWVMI
jgi:hypothetical protein